MQDSEQVLQHLAEGVEVPDRQPEDPGIGMGGESGIVIVVFVHGGEVPRGVPKGLALLQ